METEKKFLFERLESVQSMMLPPTLFDGIIERELNLSDEFVDSCVSAYSLIDELLAMLAGHGSTNVDVISWWKANAPRAGVSEYSELPNSEFGRVVIHLIESAMCLK